jgi:RNA polymerase sigma-70 factor, ECF subfamily
MERVDMSLRELIAGARSGSGEAFATLVEPYLGRALSAATLIVGSADEGADVVQESLESAWRGLPKSRHPEAFGMWFRRQVVRNAWKVARRRRATTSISDSWMDPIDHIEEGLSRRNLARAFSSLGDADRVLLTLRYHLAVPIAEAADLLGIPEGTVQSRVHHAIERLRAAYDAEERA